MSLLVLSLGETDLHHQDRFRGVVRHISPYILRELEGLAPNRSRTWHLLSVKPPPNFKRAIEALSGVSFFRLWMLGVSPTPTSPPRSYSRTSR
jgi:hypothetical protein